MEQINYKKIAVRDLVPNEWNPNLMDQNIMDGLIDSIKINGNLNQQPILVRTHPLDNNKYQIIDGEHRYTACKELGITDVECIIEDFSDKDARIATLTMNKLRGNEDAYKLAKLLQELKTVYSVGEEELMNALKYTSDDLASYESIFDFVASKYVKSGDELENFNENFGSDGESVSFLLQPSDIVYVRNLIALSGETSIESGLCSIFKKYLDS